MSTPAILPADFFSQPPPESPTVDRPKIDTMVDEASRKHGVDPDLVHAVIKNESAYKPDAVSPKGAMGLMQLMPGTARTLGVDPADPGQNIEGGVRLLKQNLDANGGDLNKALAAYNAGQGAVDQHGGVPPYPETQAYVKNVSNDFQQRKGGDAPDTLPADFFSKAPDTLPADFFSKQQSPAASPPPQQAQDDSLWDVAKKTFTTPLPQALSDALGKYGPGKVTTLQQHYENVRDAVANSSFGKDATGLLTSDGRNKSAEWLLSAADSLAKGATGAMDFLTSPLGIASAAAPGAAGAIVKGSEPLVGGAVRSVYAGSQAPEAVQKVQQFAKSPSAETFGPAVAATTGAALPVVPEIAGAAGAVAEANPIADWIDNHNAEAEQLVEQDRIKGIQQSHAAGQAESIPIKINGEPHTLVAAGGGPTTGRPFYQVLDADGKVVNAGTGDAVQQYLQHNGATTATGEAPTQTPSEAVPHVPVPNEPIEQGKAGIPPAPTVPPAAESARATAVDKSVTELNKDLESAKDEDQRTAAWDAHKQRLDTVNAKFEKAVGPDVVKQQAAHEAALSELRQPPPATVPEAEKAATGYLPPPNPGYEQELPDLSHMGLPEFVVKHAVDTLNKHADTLKIAAERDKIDVDPQGNWTRDGQPMSKTEAFGWLTENTLPLVAADYGLPASATRAVLKFARENVGKFQELAEKGGDGQEMVDDAAQAIEKGARLPKYPQNQPAGPGERLETPARAERAAIPEEGPSDYAQRVQDARQRIASRYGLGDWKDVNNVDRLEIDKEVREGKGFAMEPWEFAALVKPNAQPVPPAQPLPAGSAASAPSVSPQAAPPESAKTPDNISPESKTQPQATQNAPSNQEAKGEVETPTTEPEHKFSSTQVNLPERHATLIKSFANKIPDDKLAEGGREDEPHATVLYGLHANEPSHVSAALHGEEPITAKIGKLSLFPANKGQQSRGGRQYDVLKLDVESPDLHRLNEKVSKSGEVTNNFPEYTPHITVAYLKPGEGAKYVGKSIPGVTGSTIKFNSVVFSPHEGEKTQIPLKSVSGPRVRQTPTPIRTPAPVAPAEMPQATPIAARKPVHPMMPELRVQDNMLVDQNGGTVAMVNDDNRVDLAPPYDKMPEAQRHTLVGVIERTMKAHGSGNQRGEGIPESGRPSHPVRHGEITQVRVPGEKRAFRARYALRELDDVIPSHNPFTLLANEEYPFRNDRNYSDQRNAERIVKQTAEFDPEYVASESATAVDGAPIVDKEGAVLGGNSRVMTIARVYKQKPEEAKAYKDLLKTKATQFGLTPEDVDGMNQPVLVRELTHELSPEEVQSAITDLNKVGTAALSSAERAVSDSGRVSQDTLEQLAGMIENQGAHGTLSEALAGNGGRYIVDRLIKDGVITTQEKPELFSSNGALTTAAKDRISKLMLGRLFEDSAQLENTAPALRNKLERIVAPLARVAGKPDWDLLPDVRQAIRILDEARATGTKNLDDLVAQQGLFGPAASEYSPRAIELAKTIDQYGPVKLAQAFSVYATDSKGPTMFGEVTPEQAFADAFGSSVSEQGGIFSDKGGRGARPHDASSPSADTGVADGSIRDTFLKDESGQINATGLTLGLNKFIEHDVTPTVQEAAETLAQAHDDVLKTLLPQARGGPTTRKAELSIRNQLAKFRREMILAQKATAEANAMFEKKGDEFSKNFILTYFGDETQPLPQTGDAAMDAIAKEIRRLSDSARVHVQDLGTGKLKDYYVNYFAHIWKDRRKAEGIFASYFGKRPLEGPKAFLKKRKYPNFKDAIEAGLDPITWNPIRLTLAKIAEQERYVMAHRILDEWKKANMARFVPIDQARPAGWRQIVDPIGTVYGPRIQHISEFPNEGLYSALQKTADALNLKHTRGFKNIGEAVGRAHKGKGLVETRHGSAEDVLAHEIGHQIDWLAGSGTRFLRYGNEGLARQIKEARTTVSEKSSSPAARKAARDFLRSNKGPIDLQKTLNKELRALADLRAGNKSYTHKREEKMALLAEMWVGARDLFEKTALTAFREWRAFLNDNAKLHALRDIAGNTEVTAISQPYDVGGMVIKGYWHAPEAAAHLLNNYLSPGLRNHGWYKALFGLNNVMNQWQLGLSAFHLGFTAMDSAVSRGALAVEAALRGHPVKMIRYAAGVPLAPIVNFYHGNKVLREYELPGSQGKAIQQIVEGLVTAGGSARMDELYGTKIRDRMVHMFRNGNIWGGLWRTPFAGVEVISDIIMREIVPRQKLGVFYDMARYDLDRLGPNASFDDIRDTLAKAWDSVDNRMGQMVYDNLFWNRIAKDTAMLMVRSVGWNLGTIREVGGGAVDAIKIPIQLAGGMPPEKVNVKRLSYVVALAVIGAVFGAMYQYLRTGKPPEELKDLYFPQNGLLDEAGRSQRVAPPMYTTDVYHYSVDFKKTISDKASPILNLFAEMAHNEDFYHQQIINGDDPLIQQMQDAAEYAGSKMTPMGLRNFEREQRLGATTGQKVEQFFGMKPAPATLNQTPAERLATEITMSHLPAGSHSKGAGARYDAENDIAHRAAAGQDFQDQAQDYAQRGILTGKEIYNAAHRAHVQPLVRRFNSLGAEDALKVWKSADPEEKEMLRPLMVRKMALARTRPPAEREVLIPEFQEALTQ